MGALPRHDRRRPDRVSQYPVIKGSRDLCPPDDLLAFHALINEGLQLL